MSERPHSFYRLIGRRPSVDQESLTAQESSAITGLTDLFSRAGLADELRLIYGVHHYSEMQPRIRQGRYKILFDSHEVSAAHSDRFAKVPEEAVLLAVAGESHGILLEGRTKEGFKYRLSHIAVLLGRGAITADQPMLYIGNLGTNYAYTKIPMGREAARTWAQKVHRKQVQELARPGRLPGRRDRFPFMRNAIPFDPNNPHEAIRAFRELRQAA